MKISEYIVALEAIKAEHGDLEVETTGFDLRRIAARKPEIEFRKILSGRNRSPRFWNTWDGDAAKGEKVASI